MHIMGHCIHCMTTASTFPDNAGGSASTAGTLHPPEVALKSYCNHCRLTASNSRALHPLSQHTAANFWYSASTAWALHPRSGTLQLALQPHKQHGIQLKWHCRCSTITAGSLHPPSWALHPPSQHTACTFWDSASNACTLHPRSRTMQSALQTLKR